MIDLTNNSEIVERLKEDGDGVFEVVYKHYFAPLYSFATQFVSKDVAEGTVQETMIWLWKNKSSLIPELSLKSLLFTIVKNRCLNYIKRERLKSNVHNSIKEKFEEEFSHPDFYLEKELMRLYKEALDKLSPAFREAFEMSRFAGLTHKEIAEKLEVSVQTVNYRIGNALAFLRKELKDYLPVIMCLLSFG